MYLFILGYIWLGNATLLVKWLTANEIFQPTSPKMLHGEIKTSFLHFSSCHMLLPRAVRTRVMIFFLLFTLKTITSFCRHYMDPIISVGLDGTDSGPALSLLQPLLTCLHLACLSDVEGWRQEELQTTWWQGLLRGFPALLHLWLNNFPLATVSTCNTGMQKKRLCTHHALFLFFPVVLHTPYGDIWFKMQ